MLEVLTAIGALAPLLAALLETWHNTRPARTRAKLETDYDRDLARTDAALRTGHADALSQLFEQERRLGIRDRGLDPRGDDLPFVVQPSEPWPAPGGSDDHNT